MERELARVSSAIREAGKRAMDLARQGFEIQIKKDRSPVTTADLEVNRVLHEMQETYFPDDGWLSEESPDDPARLVEAGVPVLGAIFNPSTDELFTATVGQGLRLNGRPVSPAAPVDERSQVLVSPWEYRGGRWADFDGRIQCRPMLSIAYAMAVVAVGRVQATLTIEPENEWDLVAGVLLVQESGGTVADAEGRPFLFNQATPRFRGVIAVSATAGAELRPFLQTHADRARLKQNRP
jgi:myo-inositol-1(or 4)-monophosphatase